MKFIKILILLLFGFSVNAQNLTLAVKLNISGSSTNVGSSFTFGGTVIDDNGILNAADVLVGDSIFYLEEGIIYPLVITTKNSASGASLNVTCLSGTPSVTTAPSGSISGQVAISRKTFTGYCSVPSGLNATLASAMENRFKQQVDLAIVNAQEIAFTSGTGVPNSTVATSLGYRLAKNNGGDGDLYEWNGITWVIPGGSGWQQYQTTKAILGADSSFVHDPTVDTTFIKGTVEIQGGSINVGGDGSVMPNSHKIRAIDNGGAAAIGIIRSSTNAFGPKFEFYKSRGTTQSPLAVSSNDVVGAITFFRYNGTGYIQSNGLFSKYVVGTGGQLSITAVDDTGSNTTPLTAYNTGVSISNTSDAFANSAQLHVRGVNSSSSSKAFLFENVSGNTIMSGYNDRKVIVGNNSTPTETFDIDGTLRVRQSSSAAATKVWGATVDGAYKSLVLGNGLSISNDTLKSASGSNITVSDSPTIDLTLSSSNITAAVQSNSLDSSFIKDKTIRLLELNQSGATIGQAPVWDGNKWAPGSVSSSSNMDVTYNNFGGTASKITVDGGEGQTGGLEFETTGSNNVTFDMQGTGNVLFQKTGLTVAGLYNNGYFGINVSPIYPLHIKSAGSVAGTPIFRIDNSANTNLLFDVRQNGDIWTAGNTYTPTILASDGRIRTNRIEPQQSSTFGLEIAGGTVAGITFSAFSTQNGTSGNYSVARTGTTFSPTSGNMSFASLTLAGVFNQTGTANGITQSLYINPTIYQGTPTSSRVTDYRAIEVENGPVWFKNNGFLRLHNITTAQRDTFDNASHGAGSVIYNTSTNTFQALDNVSYKNIITSQASSISGTLNEETFVATSLQTSFTTTYNAPVVSGTNIPVRVYRNGVRLFYVASGPSVTEFTYSGTTVTTSANSSGDKITVEYLK